LLGKKGYVVVVVDYTRGFSIQLATTMRYLLICTIKEKKKDLANLAAHMNIATIMHYYSLNYLRKVGI